VTAGGAGHRAVIGGEVDAEVVVREGLADGYGTEPLGAELLSPDESREGIRIGGAAGGKR
jgi:hypothetical protein